MKRELLIKLLNNVSRAPVEQKKRRFWIAGTATCELEVCDVVGTYYAVEDIQDVFGDILSFFDEGRVCDEAVMLTAYQAYGLEVW